MGNHQLPKEGKIFVAASRTYDAWVWATSKGIALERVVHLGCASDLLLVPRGGVVYRVGSFRGFSDRARERALDVRMGL